MALGKRTRSSVEDAAVSTRASKRRIVVSDANDENENPFVSQHASDDERPTKRTRAVKATSAKHATTNQRVVPASPKISAHFRATKGPVDIYQDAKQTTLDPSTPRHRDALSKQVPITPRHRIIVGGCKLTPKTPRTPGTPSAAISVYNIARQLFSRSSNPGKLVGREEERRQLEAFVARCRTQDAAGCLYVSGPPGTGKSALIDEVCQSCEQIEDVKMSVVNCMSIRTAKDLSKKLAQDLDLSEDAGFESLRKTFTTANEQSATKYLVILDEVDCLVDLDLALLYNLFEWSMQPHSQLSLIGIANALDLTDRFLPRLKSRSLTPELLPFMPYSAAQIAQVLTAKLRSIAPTTTDLPFLHPAAIQFCAKKVATQSGDLRKAFDICRRAIDLVEQETKENDARVTSVVNPSKTPLMENINLSSPVAPRSPAKSPLKPRSTAIYTLETAPRATIAHMAKVTSLAFSNGTTQRLSTLNLQQRAVLCALSALEARNRASQTDITAYLSTPTKSNKSAPSTRQLFEAYTKLCTREKLLHPLSNIEFRVVVSGLETLSLVQNADGKNGSFVSVTPSKTPGRKGKGGFGGMAMTGDERRVAGVVSQKELTAALDGPGGALLKEILEGDALLI
ncbi:hypothetical protein B0A48_07082 [Cryoendolithus antarcticus]|uniref:Cell division control protein n=1 Tax=Cryoendolithus antarcticus TaxID=1507870 RepID=A0A1V8T7K9_9PEZI|nr:hypothetical protein B0A48_07082 [Cryoendolithus antarcticus]